MYGANLARRLDEPSSFSQMTRRRMRKMKCASRVPSLGRMLFSVFYKLRMSHPQSLVEDAVVVHGGAEVEGGPVEEALASQVAAPLSWVQAGEAVMEEISRIRPEPPAS